MTALSNKPVALVTGGAKRIGAEICRTLHRRGFNVVLHYRHAESEAMQLLESLNHDRPGSCVMHQASLCNIEDIESLALFARQAWGRLDVLVNNASSFYPTELSQAKEEDWDELMSSNLKGAFFLSQKLAPALKVQQGCIVNIIDIYAQNPLKGHPIYCIAKAGLVAMTQALALELGPDVRVNGVSPGAILWPEANEPETNEPETNEPETREPKASGSKVNESQAFEQGLQQEIIKRTCLQRRGEPQDIAQTVAFLVEDALFITGQIIAVDGGRLSR